MKKTNFFVFHPMPDESTQLRPSQTVWNRSSGLIERPRIPSARVSYGYADYLIDWGITVIVAGLFSNFLHYFGLVHDGMIPGFLGALGLSLVLGNEMVDILAKADKFKLQHLGMSLCFVALTAHLDSDADYSPNEHMEHGYNLAAVGLTVCIAGGLINYILSNGDAQDCLQDEENGLVLD